MQRDANGAFAAGAVTVSSISAGSATLSGALNGAAVTLSGALNGTTATFSGGVTGTTGTFTGRLSTSSVNGMVATGDYGSGTIPVEGAGVRMMWYPRRAAFRVGAIESGVDETAWNDANIGDGSIAMGTNTRATGLQSTSIGIGTLASAQGAVAIGFGSQATGLAAYAMGFNTVSSGQGATAIGFSTIASGNASTAMGYGVSTAGFEGSFIYGDRSNLVTTLENSAANQFMVRAAGGSIIYSNAGATAGVTLAPGDGAWSSVSDRNRKMDFVSIDGEEILSRVRTVPVTEWSYRSQGTAVRHMGPMAQDFRAAFGLGTSELMINSIDIDGVNLAAIHALIARTDRLREENAALQREVQTLRAQVDRVDALTKRLEELERKQP